MPISHAKTLSFRPRGLSLCSLVLVLLANFFQVAPGICQELYYLGLQQPGQASVAIDSASQTAYIVDLGRDRAGRNFEIEGKPLLSFLSDRQVKSLIVVCSHPHVDHMGGIKAIFETPSEFFTDSEMTQPRFDKVTIVENAVPEDKSLYSILRRSLKQDSATFLTRISAATENALANISKSSAQVYIETVPYRPREKTGVHGRSIVTLIVIGGTFTILDPDDASTEVIQEVVANLRNQGIHKIDSFVVPHHGSKYNDLTPILELGPTSAIISVNPANRYRHPSPEILKNLILTLGASNVYFTGSDSRIKIGPSGVDSYKYSAAQEISYNKFVLPSRLYLEGRGEITPEAAELFSDVHSLMVDGNSPQQRVEREETIRELATDLIVENGTVLSPEAEMAKWGPDGVSQENFKENQIFSQGKEEQRLITTISFHGSPGADSSEILNKLPQGIKARLMTTAGAADGLQPILESEATGEHLAQASERLPAGGMVYLRGGKMYAGRDTASALGGGSLTICGEVLCIKPKGIENIPYIVPIKLGLLFSEVFKKTQLDGVEAFYLSINPTRRTLDATNTGRLEEVPYDRLRYGTDESDLRTAANEVVTGGNVENSIIGRILWEADVKFKSEALGFDVLEGDKRTSPRPRALVDLPRDSEEFLEAGLSLGSENRWCRLYWASGSQTVEISNSHKSVNFKGAAVLANAEPLKLGESGKLVPAVGSWCSEAMSVASSLERQANSPTPAGVLSELRQLAETQSFLKWTREQGIMPSSDLLNWITRTSQESGKIYQTPRWTSGIRSKSSVVLQEEIKQLRRGQNQHFLHVSFSDSETLRECVLPQWLTQEQDFLAAGYLLDETDNTWKDRRNREVKDGFLGRWMHELATRIAGCSDAITLPPSRASETSIDTELGDVSDELTSFGLFFHMQPTQFHGGVLLGGWQHQNPIESAWQKGDLLRSPDGQLLFMAKNEHVHFWNRASIGDAEVLSHIDIGPAKILSSYAADGRLRFLIDSKPGGIMRSELRGIGVKAFPDGFEWTNSGHGQSGDKIAEMAVWPCVGSSVPSCVRARELSYSELEAALGDQSKLINSVIVTWVGPSAWLVDLNIEETRKWLEQKWDQLENSDRAGKILLARSFLDWGFGDAITEKLEVPSEQDNDSSYDVLSLPMTSISPKAARSLIQNTKVLAQVAKAVDEGEAVTATLIDQLVSAENSMDKLDAGTAAPFWSGLNFIVMKLTRLSGLEAQLQSRLTELEIRIGLKAKRSAALVAGGRAADGLFDFMKMALSLTQEKESSNIEEGSRSRSPMIMFGELVSLASETRRVDFQSPGQFDINAECIDCEGINVRVLDSESNVVATTSNHFNAQSGAKFDMATADFVMIEVTMGQCHLERCLYHIEVVPSGVSMGHNTSDFESLDQEKDPVN